MKKALLIGAILITGASAQAYTLDNVGDKAESNGSKIEWNQAHIKEINEKEMPRLNKKIDNIGGRVTTAERVSRETKSSVKGLEGSVARNRKVSLANKNDVNANYRDILDLQDGLKESKSRIATMDGDMKKVKDNQGVFIGILEEDNARINKNTEELGRTKNSIKELTERVAMSEAERTSSYEAAVSNNEVLERNISSVSLMAEKNETDITTARKELGSTTAIAGRNEKEIESIGSDMNKVKQNQGVFTEILEEDNTRIIKNIEDIETNKTTAEKALSLAGDNEEEIANNFDYTTDVAQMARDNKAEADKKIAKINSVNDRQQNTLDDVEFRSEGNSRDIRKNKLDIESATNMAKGANKMAGDNNSKIFDMNQDIKHMDYEVNKNAKLSTQNQTDIGRVGMKGLENEKKIAGHSNVIGENSKAIAENTDKVNGAWTVLGDHAEGIKGNRDGVETNAEAIKSNHDYTTDVATIALDNEKSIKEVKTDVKEGVERISSEITESHNSLNEGIFNNNNRITNVEWTTEENKGRIDEAENKIRNNNAIASNAMKYASENEDRIADNEDKIEDNSKNIEKNEKSIKENSEKTSTNTKVIKNNSGRIDNNTRSISNNSHRIDRVEKRVDHIENEMNRGLAMSAATASIVYPTLGEGDMGIGAGIGGYGNSQAVAVGTALQVSEEFRVNGNVATSDGQDVMYGAGFGYKFNVFN